jgi:hypothetical protein
MDPLIQIDTPAHDATVSGTVDIDVTASDPGSGIQRVEIYIEEALVANLTSGFSISWETTTLANGTYSITAIAYDAAGNSAQVTHIVLVQNADSPTTPTTTPPPGIDTAMLLIVVAVAGVVVVIVILILVKKKGQAS